MKLHFYQVVNILILNYLSKEQLIDLLIKYNDYIQEANEENHYQEGWFPVSIYEFYENEYKEDVNK